MAIVKIQEARMKNRHSFEVMKGVRRGNTTAPSLSTAIRTTLSIDTTAEMSWKKWTILYKAWPSNPPINQECTYNSVRNRGMANIMSDTADRTWPCLRLRS